MARARRRLRRLAEEVAKRFPDLADPCADIARGRILVDGRIARNPESLVPGGIALRLRREAPLRGEVKLRAALAAFGVPAEGRVALDLGASAGGFTRALLRAGARRVYAVDAGHGQLLGSLRQDPRVVNLERTNLAALDRQLVADTVDVVTVDLSYVALSLAVGQLGGLAFGQGADMIALVKPMYELGLARPPADPRERRRAVERASRALLEHGWRPMGSMESPAPGRRGAIEHLIHARRRG